MHSDLLQENADLKEQIRLLSKEVEASALEIGYLKDKNSLLEKKLRAAIERLFGRKSEKSNPDQMKLFREELLKESLGELGSSKDQPVDDSEADFEEPPKRKRRGGRKPLPKDLERERVHHDPAPDELACPCCGEERVRIGEEVTEELEYVPARAYVIEHVRGKYACRKCEEGVLIKDLPPRPIEKGRPGSGLLAHVLVSKYADHQPLYRQEKIFARHGIDLSRSTLCDWVGWMADLLRPLVKEMKRELFERNLIQSDDTPVRVQDKSVKGKMRKGYLWSYCEPGGQVVYDFTMSRSRDGPIRFLAGFEGGYLQADGYAGYNAALRGGELDHIGCMAHVRRKFYAARHEAPEHSGIVLAAIQKLYRLEREMKESDADVAERVRVRQEQALPTLETLETTFRDMKEVALPQSELGKAVSYALGQWPSIKRYTEVGEAEIDNNSCESSIRGIAVGRKNWLCVSRRRNHDDDMKLAA